MSCPREECVIHYIQRFGRMNEYRMQAMYASHRRSIRKYKSVAERKQSSRANCVYLYMCVSSRLDNVRVSTVALLHVQHRDIHTTNRCGESSDTHVTANRKKSVRVAAWLSIGSKSNRTKLRLFWKIFDDQGSSLGSVLNWKLVHMGM